MPNGRSASVLVPLSSLIRPQRISWRAASRHIHELRRHRETLRPAGQHSRRGVAPVCSLERVRPLERDTGPSEGLRLRFGKEKTLAARDNSVGILGAGGHRGRIPPSAGPEGSHERVPSARRCSTPSIRVFHMSCCGPEGKLRTRVASPEYRAMRGLLARWFRAER